MIRLLLTLVLLTGCVHGEPFEPSSCPDVVVYIAPDSATRGFVVDSIIYPDSTHAECDR